MDRLVQPEGTAMIVSKGKQFHSKLFVENRLAKTTCFSQLPDTMEHIQITTMADGQCTINSIYSTVLFLSLLFLPKRSHMNNKYMILCALHVHVQHADMYMYIHVHVLVCASTSMWMCLSMHA